MAKDRQRADVALVDRGLVSTRARAQALILAGKVYSGDRRIEKAGQPVGADTPLSLKGEDHPWASRGGLKLAHALDHFGIETNDRVAADIGASTGGFTDVLLAHGARKVYAIDVGHGQLAWKLRQDPRVIVLERTNARHIGAAEVPEPIDMLVCDASFIGLEQILPAPMALVAPGGVLVALIKPQFEVGKGRVGAKGVVRDPLLHQEVQARIHDWIDAQPGWRTRGLLESPITGPEGNKEFLIVADRA